MGDRFSGLVSVRRDRDPATLSPDDLEAPLSASRADLRFLFALCRWAGLRRSECLALQGKDVADGVVRIRSKMVEHGE